MSVRRSGASKHAKIREEAEALIKQTGLPRNIAFQVAMGQMTLNEALRNLSVHGEVEKLIRRHDFPRSLAMQIALGQISLDEVLFKQRLKKYTAENRARSFLAEAESAGTRLSFLLHGQTRRSGVVSDVKVYSFTLTPKKGAAESIHKLRVRAAWDAKKNAAVMSVLKRDPAHAHITDPIVKPQDRFHCADRRLFLHMEAGDVLAVRLLEGDVVVGTVSWIGRWEFGIKTKKGVVVTVFRHAMAAIQGA